MISLKSSAIQRAPYKYALRSTELNRVPSTLEDFNGLLKEAADSKNLKFGKTVHAQLIVSNHTSPNSRVNDINSLINLYAKCDELLIAHQLFGQMSNRNVVSWSSLMTGYMKNGNTFEVLRLFKEMISAKNSPPNEYTISTVISSCCDSGWVEEGIQCHVYALKTGLEFHQYVKNVLIQLYSRCRDVEGAMRILNTVPGCDIFCYNLVISGLIEHAHFKEVMEVLAIMVHEAIAWDSVTYVTLFGLCARVKNAKLGMQIHGQMLKNDIELDFYIGSAIIDMYGKCNKVVNARKFFDSLLNQNVVSWTAIMAAYYQNGNFEEALNLLASMERVIAPNEYTLAVLLNCCANLSALCHGNQLHASAEKAGLTSHTVVGNALIIMYSKSGDIVAANLVFSDIISRDLITWNAMICGFSQHGLGKEALRVFQDMLIAGECPNYITFIGVLSACAHLGLVNEGFYYLYQMKKEIGIEPGLEHYTCIVGLLTKAGQLDEAENFMRSTPVKWDVIAWRTLLNACHIHQKHGLGRKIADFVLQLGPEDVGTYILLSNMYARARRWDGVAKIRKGMRERNIKKEPGVSWLEIKNITHVFVSEDNKHPDSNKIYEKVRELLGKIKLLGYDPDISAVTHDVEDEQKQDNLSYHSEKLAIAYGLMKLPSGAPIRVIKNLRMCDDCHSAVKLISKVSERLIIVRDANRFHHFEDGHCSCADYWSLSAEDDKTKDGRLRLVQWLCSTLVFMRKWRLLIEGPPIGRNLHVMMHPQL